MSSTRQEQVISLPAEVIRKCNGFSFDFGGSVLKLVYRTREDFEDASKNESPEHMAPARLVSFSRQELDEAIEFIKEHAYISRTPAQDTVIYTTGIGGSQYKEKFEKVIDIKCVNIPEEDCFVRSLTSLLKTVPKADLTIPFDVSATELPIAETKEFMLPFLEAAKKGEIKLQFPGKAIEDITADDIFGGLVDGMQATGDPSKPMVQTETDLYPIGLGILGSAFGVGQVTEDGAFMLGKMTNRGGRAFLAMGHLFLGCKDYHELLTWAKAGDSDKVDWCVKDVMAEMPTEAGANPTAPKEEKDDDFYSKIHGTSDTNTLIFNFGKGVAAKKEDFKKEDLAAALLRFYCMELADAVDAAQMACGMSHVFLVGSFVADEYVRRLVTRELTASIIQRNFSGATGSKPYCFHFMPHGPHLGALGALINCLKNTE